MLRTDVEKALQKHNDGRDHGWWTFMWWTLWRCWFETVFLRILENSWARSVGERV